MRDRKGVDLDGWGLWEVLRRIEGGKTIINMYCMRKQFITSRGVGSVFHFTLQWYIPHFPHCLLLCISSPYLATSAFPIYSLSINVSQNMILILTLL